MKNVANELQCMLSIRIRTLEQKKFKNPNIKCMVKKSKFAASERDLGVIVGSSMKVSLQCATSVKKEDLELGISRKVTES